MKKRIVLHAPYLLFLFLPIGLFHWKIVFAGELICGGDLINQFIPWRKFALGELSAGRFPLWNPYVFCGAPFLANIQTSLFYPWNLFHVFFSVERVFSLSLVFHHLLAAGSMYLFLHHLWRSKGGAAFGAVVYAWSGFLITHGHDGHLIHVRAYALIPLALYFQTCWRENDSFGRLFVFALVLAGMFYAGHTQIPLYIFYLLLARGCWWFLLEWQGTHNLKSALLLPAGTLAGIILSLLLSAAVLFPLYELSQHTAGRAGGADYEFATHDSLPPSHLITFFAPFFYGDPTSASREGLFWETRTGYHEICGYVGLAPLLLLFFLFLNSNKQGARSRFERFESIFFLFITLAALFFSLGRYNPLYPLLYYGLPGWSYFRVPGRLTLLFILGVSVCSARGLTALFETDWRTIKEKKGIQTAIVLTGLFVTFVCILALSKPALHTWLRENEITRTLREMGWGPENRLAVSQQLPDYLFTTRYSWMIHSCGAACLFLAFGWLSFFTAQLVRWKHRWIVPCAVLLVDLVLFSHRFVTTKPAARWRDEFFPQVELTKYLQTNSHKGRVLCLDDAISISALQTHPELRPNRLMEYGIETIRGYDPIILQSYTRYVNRIYGQPLDAPQGGFLFFPAPSADSMQGFGLLNARYIVTAMPLSTPYELVWTEEYSGLLIYENKEIRPRFSWQNEMENSTIEIIQSNPNQVELITQSKKKNRLIWSQNHYPGWRVYVNGERRPVELYENTFQSVETHPGRSRIEFRFFPGSFINGSLVAFVTFIGSVFFILWERRK